jgi:hypothetical protein
MLSIERAKLIVYSPVSGEAETSSGGDQLVRNSLIDWNGHGALKRAPTSNHSKSIMPKKTQPRFANLSSKNSE